MKNFILIGSAGYIAERHIKAIKELGHNLIACYDKFDVMGKIDSYFPQAEFFTSKKELLEFIPHYKVDYISICTPNYTHHEFIEMGLSNYVDVICEKPMVTKFNYLRSIKIYEDAYGHKAFTILQLRYHPTILKIRKEVMDLPNKRYKINLIYITSRGKWYHKTWKADFDKSGGLTMNIGVHFFDMLLWIFGGVKSFDVDSLSSNSAKGKLNLEKADVEWFLSIDSKDLPNSAKYHDQSTYRSIAIDGHEIEFSGGFTDLHTVAYDNIINGNGYGVDDVYNCIKLVNEINNELY